MLDSLMQLRGESSAAEHGRAMQEQGFTIEDVVYDYGDLRLAIVEIASECEASVSEADLDRLARRLDTALATAAGQFEARQRAMASDEHSKDVTRQLGIFAHALRNHLTTATLAVHISRTGNAGLSGPSGQILDRSLKGLAQLIDRSLVEARLGHATVVEPEVFSLASFIAEVQSSSSLEADAAQCRFIVAPVDPGLEVRGDRDLLLSTLGSLLQNAFKFTQSCTEVRLKAYVQADRIRVDIEDDCGGLPPGGLERMFLPYGHRRGDQTGVGMGLCIARKSVEANDGTLSVKDVPGSGCIFTIDLPMLASAPAGADAAS